MIRPDSAAGNGESAAQSALEASIYHDGCCGLITTIPGRDFRFAKAPLASKFAPGEFVIFSASA
jgi:hypothetical protein